MTTSRLRIVVLGYIVRGPLGGLAWHHLQYVMGLSALGHDVTFLEHGDEYPSCYDPSRDVVDGDPGYGLRFAAHAFGKVGLGEAWAYHDAQTGAWHGPAAGRIPDLSSSADLVLNLSGVNPLRSGLDAVPARALVDTDPVFTQVRHLTDAAAREEAARHTSFFTFGANTRHLGGSFPDDGFPWQPTRQPVVLDAWPVTRPPAGGKLTTVMQWDSYKARTHDGRRFGMKSDSFAAFLDLPSRTSQPLELALGSATAPRALLREKGWGVVDPLAPTRDPWTYQEYIRASKAELGVAKHGYVAGRCGWFSERSAAYLASGRPVLAQDTGFSDWLPTGEGLLAFTGLEEAVNGIEAIGADLERHARAARAVAEAYFDARHVLPSLLERALSRSPLPAEAGAVR